MQKLSLLSRPAILRHLEAGNIIIDPFDERNLGTVSYDVCLGEWYFREANPVEAGGPPLYNPYSETEVARIWGLPQIAEPAAAVVDRMIIMKRRRDAACWRDVYWEGIALQDRIIVITPGETILCHTREFIGGRGCVTTLMKARSSMGKNFIEVCKCAGWGDVGFINRWTMEVTNNSRYYHIPLVVGRRIAQICFFEVEPLEEDYVGLGGKYQTERTLKEVKAMWRPETMLPRLDKDFEVEEAERRWQEYRESWEGGGENE